jgi:hypothetical protein
MRQDEKKETLGEFAYVNFPVNLFPLSITYCLLTSIAGTYILSVYSFTMRRAL